MSNDSQQEEFDLIGNILSEEEKNEDCSPESNNKQEESISPASKKSIKL